MATRARTAALFAMLVCAAWPSIAAEPSSATTPTLALVETARFDVEIGTPRAVAAIKEDGETRFLVGGESGINVYRADGRRLRRIETPEALTSLAVSAETGNIFASSKTRVFILSPDGRLLDAWGEAGEEPGQLRYITSLAVDDPVVFVADVSNRRLSRFAVNGDYVDSIEGHLVPSPHFDCAVDTSGTLQVTDPGRHSVVCYDANMEPVGRWGLFGNGPENFCGCCNPTDIASLPGGRTATTEKGVPRLKVYDRGKRVVAFVGPEHFPRLSEGMDLAVDSVGRIVLLEPFEKTVRVYRLAQRDGGTD